MVKNPHSVQETWIPSLCSEDPLEEGMATHSSILAWRIPMEPEWSSGFPYSLQFKSEFGNKEFMI